MYIILLVRSYKASVFLAVVLYIISRVLIVHFTVQHVDCSGTSLVPLPGDLSTGAPSDISNMTPQSNGTRSSRCFCILNLWLNLPSHACYVHVHAAQCACMCSASQYRWEEETDRGISRNFPAQVSVQEVYIMHELILHATCCIGRFHLKTAGIHKSYVMQGAHQVPSEAGQVQW